MPKAKHLLESLQQLPFPGSALGNDTARLGAMQHPKDIGEERAVIGGDDLDPLEIVPRHAFGRAVWMRAGYLRLGTPYDRKALGIQSSLVLYAPLLIPPHPGDEPGDRSTTPPALG